MTKSLKRLTPKKLKSKRKTKKIKKQKGGQPNLIRTNGDIHNAVHARSPQTHGHISNWDTSQVTDMSKLFQNKRDFNDDISNWDTSNVTNMEGMFLNAISFNQPIGAWDTSKVTTMYSMFNGARSFNQPIGEWDTHNVTSMVAMFRAAKSFNQPIRRWDVSSIINNPSHELRISSKMENMFVDARSFNQDLTSWNNDVLSRIAAEHPHDDGVFLKNHMFKNSNMKLINYPIYGPQERQRIGDESRNTLNNGVQQGIRRMEDEGLPETSTSKALGNNNLRGLIGSYLGGKNKVSKKTLKKKVTKKKTKKTKKIKK